MGWNGLPCSKRTPHGTARSALDNVLQPQRAVRLIHFKALRLSAPRRVDRRPHRIKGGEPLVRGSPTPSTTLPRSQLEPEQAAAPEPPESPDILVAVHDRRLTIMHCEMIGTSIQKSRCDIAASAKISIGPVE